MIIKYSFFFFLLLSSFFQTACLLAFPFPFLSSSAFLFFFFSVASERLRLLLFGPHVVIWRTADHPSKVETKDDEQGGTAGVHKVVIAKENGRKSDARSCDLYLIKHTHIHRSLSIFFIEQKKKMKR